MRTPGNEAASSLMMRAVSVSTSAMRTGSNWEPTCRSRRSMMRRAGMSVSRESRSATSGRTSKGNSAGTMRRTKVGTFSTSRRPRRSYMRPRATGMGRVVACPMAVRGSKVEACANCSWNSRRPSPLTTRMMAMPKRRPGAASGGVHRCTVPRSPPGSAGLLMSSPCQPLRLAEAQVDGPHDDRSSSRDGAVEQPHEQPGRPATGRRRRRPA